MPTKLAAGEPCGWTAASNYAGMCDRTVDPKLECIDGKCAAPAAPGPSPPAPSPPTACSNQGVKCYDGDMAEPVSGITCCNNVVCPITTDPFASAYCPVAAGTPTCTGSGTALYDVKCWDGAGNSGAGAAVDPAVACCYGDCTVSSGTVDGYCP